MFVGGTRYLGSWAGSIISFFGFFIALSRTRDKIVRAKLWNMWYRMTCRLHKQTKFDEFEKLVEQSQTKTFLKTSLNTELVITILKGIVILAASSSDKVDHMDDAEVYQIRQVQTVELQKIKLKDAKQFTINEQG